MNRKDFKKSISGVQPSKQMIERIMNMPNNDEQKNKRLKLAPAIALVACFIIVITSVFSGDEIIEMINPPTEQNSLGTISDESNNTTLSSKVAQGFAMIVYANDEMKDIEFVGDMNKLTAKAPFITKFGVVDIRGKSESEVQKISDDLYNKIRITKKNTVYGEINYISTSNIETLDNTIIYQARCGCFDFDFDENGLKFVKEIKVKNENKKFGIMEIRALDVLYDNELNRKYDGVDYTKSAYIKGSSISLDGERYAKCKAIEKKEGNHSFFGINWKLSDNAYELLDKNPSFDLSTIKDTITFEVEFNDGSISRTVVNIAFDKEGKMYAVDGDYDFIE